MTDLRPMPPDDDALAQVLRALSSEVAWPSAAPVGGPDVAARVRARLVTPVPERRSWWRPARRALVLALIALLALAAIAGAVRLGIPGLRLTLGGPAPTASLPPTAAPSDTPAPGALGEDLRLGVRADLAELDAESPATVPRPTDPAVGAPAAAYIDAGRGSTALVFPSSPTLPPTLEPGVGMVLVAFDGTVEEAYGEKVLRSGSTLERVTVGGHPGFWISGDPHFFYYVRPDGRVVEETGRWVGDALIWSDGQTGYRLESGLDRDAAIRVAESID